MMLLVFYVHFLYLCKQVLISNAEQAESLIAQAVIKRATAMTNTNSQSRWVIKWEFMIVFPFPQRIILALFALMVLPVKSLKHCNYRKGSFEVYDGFFFA